MNWVISQFPELEHLEPQQRAQVLKRIPWWTYPAILLRALGPAVPVGGLTGLTLAKALHSLSALLIGIPVAVASAALLYAYQIGRIRIAMRRQIAMGFQGSRPPFCFKCGYNLHESIEPRCPECGKTI